MRNPNMLDEDLFLSLFHRIMDLKPKPIGVLSNFRHKAILMNIACYHSEDITTLHPPHEMKSDGTLVLTFDQLSKTTGIKTKKTLLGYLQHLHDVKLINLTINADKKTVNILLNIENIFAAPFFQGRNAYE